MIRLRITVAVLMLIVLSVSCRPDGGSKKLDIPAEFDEIVLLARRSNLSFLIPPAELATLLGKDREQIIRHRKNYDPDASRHATVFSWPSGQTVSMEGIGDEMEVFHSVSVGYVREMTEAEFGQRYGEGKALEQDIDALSTNPDVDADIAVEEVAYLAEQAKSVTYEQVDHIGLPAYWEMPAQALHIHTGGASVTVAINMGDNEQKNKGMAIQVANLLLAGAAKH
ncbi:hypothetical protein J2X69_002120 [Algoriphagus sp. 4150]|uniref:hypothetical protein n=1 Tax=Algoriphagus sp. 4150 TaxID=2817756 RepID=UPI00285A37CE|nr:hypothetical protein [Algoriphagus sp. 4150]MDR7129774.1 hypothetical protein [Algoriphagus sp. 4150]